MTNEKMQTSFETHNSQFIIHNSTFPIHSSSFPIRPCVFCDRSENSDELIGLIQQFCQAWFGDYFRCQEQAKPVVCFACCLACDGQLAHKVCPTLTGLSLFYICTN